MGKQQFLGRVEAWPPRLADRFLYQASLGCPAWRPDASRAHPHKIYRPALLGRYDWLLIMHSGYQTFMLLTKLEKPAEVIVIATFHLVGLGMEIFKTSSGIGSWSHPGHAIFMLATCRCFPVLCTRRWVVILRAPGEFLLTYPSPITRAACTRYFGGGDLH